MANSLIGIGHIGYFKRPRYRAFKVHMKILREKFRIRNIVDCAIHFVKSGVLKLV